MSVSRLQRACRRKLAAAHSAAAAKLGRASRPRADAPEPPGESPHLVRHCWELGHFYSPVPDTRELSREPARSRVWPAKAREMPGVDWREKQQLEFVREILGMQTALRFPDGPTGRADEYHATNEQFSRGDAWALQAMLRHLRPTRMIEVGCGWSSLVTAQVSREFLDGRLDLTCIDPYPPDFMRDGVDGITRVIAEPVQDVPLERFGVLGPNDVLFIDSAHVVKTGGDVQFLYHEVVPRLRPGVAIHIHDIFLPRDYPEEWVLIGRGWNEQYLVQSFLAFNDSFEVLLAMGWLFTEHPELLAGTIPGFDPRLDGGGSLWLRRCR